MSKTIFQLTALFLLVTLLGCRPDAGLTEKDLVGRHIYWLETDQTRQMDANAQELAKKFRENNPFLVDIREDGQLVFTWFQNPKGENGYWKLENGKFIIRKKSDEEAVAKNLGTVISGDYDLVSRTEKEMVFQQGKKTLYLELQ